MKNFIQKGSTLDYTIPASTTIVSGQVVIVGNIVGVAQVGGTTGDIIALAVEGVFDLPKATGAITQGAMVYWDADGNPVGGVAGSGALTTTQTGNTPVGKAWDGALSGDATVKVCIDSTALLGQGAAVADVSTANGSDPATTQALANALKVSLNALLASLRSAGIIAT